ncbi:MAG: DUF2163 domain-containing protein [Candidatus Dactylopiibacterium sp.]|nr:DUF2163 domain-containing protein [Candidatus Dactylopiibacterium sp.]
MISTTQAHLDLLASRRFVGADLYEITFVDGTAMRFSAAHITQTWDGRAWNGAGPTFERGDVRRVAGLEADRMDLTIWPREDDVLLGLPWRAAAANGVFDGATFRVLRAHSAAPGGPIVGAVKLFTGTAGEVDVTVADGIMLPVVSRWAVLDRKIPLAVFSPDCVEAVYSPGCGLSRSAHQVNGNALAGSTRALIVTGLGAANGAYVGGEIRIVSGLSAGARRTIKTHVGGRLGLAYPLPRNVAAGDSFQLWPGCNGTRARCAQLNNSDRFRGQPYVPTPETAL